MPSFKDYSGQKIGRVKIIKFLCHRSKISRWFCKCDCGKEFETGAFNFKKGKKFECLLCVRERKRGPDLSGRRYGRWTFVRRAPNDERNKTRYWLQCDCGIVRNLNPHTVVVGKTRSCGCWGRKIQSKWVNPSLYPKQSFLSTTIPKFYDVRTGLIHKCNNPAHPSYENFGAKGITVCDLWLNDARAMYEWALEKGWIESSSIMLKKGETEFNPSTSHVVNEHLTRSIIAKNRPCKYSLYGKNERIKDVAKRYGVHQATLTYRLKTCATLEEAVSFPKKTAKLKNISDSAKKKISTLYKEGKSYQEIGRKYGVGGVAISYNLKKWNVPLRDSDDRSGISSAVIKKFMGEGLSNREIGKKLGCSSVLIYYRRRKIMGIKRKR